MFKALFSGRRLLMTMLVIAGAIVMVRLGFWQLDRQSQRNAINEKIDTRMAQPAVSLADAQFSPDELEYRRVEARGVYDPGGEIVLRNRALGGAPGVHILTPLRLSGGDAAVLIDRGWLPMDLSRPEERRAYAPPPGEVVIEGIVRIPREGGPEDPPLRPGESRQDAWFQVDIPRIAEQAGYPLLPIYVEQQPTPGDIALPRRVATAGLGDGPHLSYAVQWFAFSAILLIGYVAFTYQQIRRS